VRHETGNQTRITGREKTCQALTDRTSTGGKPDRRSTGRATAGQKCRRRRRSRAHNGRRHASASGPVACPFVDLPGRTVGLPESTGGQTCTNDHARLPSRTMCRCLCISNLAVQPGSVRAIRREASQTESAIARWIRSGSGNVNAIKALRDCGLLPRPNAGIRCKTVGEINSWITIESYAEAS